MLIHILPLAFPIEGSHPFNAQEMGSTMISTDEAMADLDSGTQSPHLCVSFSEPQDFRRHEGVSALGHMLSSCSQLMCQPKIANLDGIIIKVKQILRLHISVHKTLLMDEGKSLQGLPCIAADIIWTEWRIGCSVYELTERACSERRQGFCL